jgi:hypothetical protein
LRRKEVSHESFAPDSFTFAVLPPRDVNFNWTVVGCLSVLGSKGVRETRCIMMLLNIA